MQAKSAPFLRRCPCRAIAKVRIKTGRFAQRGRIDGAQTVDHVDGEDQRYAQPRFFDRDFLQGPQEDRIERAKISDGAACPNLRLHFPDAGGGAGDRIDLDRKRCGEEGKLARFLLYRHAAKQIFDEAPFLLGKRGRSDRIDAGSHQRQRGGRAFQEMTAVQGERHGHRSLLGRLSIS